MIKNVLNDKNFLDTLFSSKERELFVRITALTFNETPIEYIEGRAIDGSVNIDGTSAVRRTCNITLVADDIHIHDFYWGIKNKFKLEIGLKNMINPVYPDIVWFKQGIFVITQFNTSQALNKWTIKIQGKDKMCLLNGDVSGNLPFNVDFAYEEQFDINTQKSTFVPVPIQTIIYKAMTEFGKEMSHNILINDIDESGQELLEYRGVEPLYIIRDAHTQEFKQITKGDKTCYYMLRDLTLQEYNNIPNKYQFLKNCYQFTDEDLYAFIAPNPLPENISKEEITNEDGQQIEIYWLKGVVSDEFIIIYDNLLEEEIDGPEATEVRFNLQRPEFKDNRYVLIQVKTGDVPGYRLSELVFGGELKANVGDSITSVLDKIKNKFTNFEYFYDIDGKFVFQKKREYLVTKWNINDENNNYLYANAVDNNIVFNFSGNQLVSSVANSPKLTELKNDYSVWGNRDNLTLHMRYAIDYKPSSYKPIRPLREEHIIITNNNGEFSDSQHFYKYFDAPEAEPYADAGLTASNDGYAIFCLILKSLSSTLGMTNVDYLAIKKVLSQYVKWETTWSLLFEQVGLSYKFIGTTNDLKDIIITLDGDYSMYDNKNTLEFIELTPDNEGEFKEEWHLIYPQFAAYPYSTENIKDEDGNIIHYKVDWRELIYQMALDYRRLNYTDNYFYYLKQQNPWCSEHRTGYEQYYIDLEGFWRMLYDPNPQQLFTTELDCKTVIDLIEQQPEKMEQLIHVKNGYEKIAERDQSQYDLSELYVYSSPADKTAEKAMYGALPSNQHCLKFNTDYYVSTSEYAGATETYNAESKTSEDYNTLNGLAFDKILVYDNNTKNYISFIDSIKDTPLKDAYIKSQQYQSLGKLKNEDIWPLYYDSELYSLGTYSQTCLNVFNKYETAFNAEVPMGSANEITKALLQYLVALSNITKLPEAISVFDKGFYDWGKSYFTKIKELIERFTKSKNNCLKKLAEAYLENLSKLPSMESGSSLDKIQVVISLNDILARFMQGIQQNLSQVSIINIKEDNPYSDMQSSELHTAIKNINIKLQHTMPLYGDDGQLAYTQKRISALWDNINPIQKITDDEIYKELKDIIDNIKILDSALQEISNCVKIHFISESEIVENFKELLLTLKNLYTVLLTNNKNDIKILMTYNGEKLLNKDFQDRLELATNVEIDNILNDLRKNTSQFNENYMRYSVNNFNHTIDDTILHEQIQYYLGEIPYNHDEINGDFWLKEIFNDPKNLIFWFDFLDPHYSELAKYSVSAIGSRLKVVNDKDVKTIHHKDIPNIIFYNSAAKDFAQFAGYAHLNLTNELFNQFAISSKGKTAKERLEELLYQHSYCQESVNLQIVPMYHLEANNRVYIVDEKSNIDGEYLITKFNIPLNYKKMMSITAIKSIDAIT